MGDIVATPSLKNDGTASQTGGSSWEVFDETDATASVQKALSRTSAFGGNAATTASGLVTGKLTKTAPGKPTSPVATGGVGQASVAFTAPASNGGSAITGYTVKSSPGHLTSTGASSPRVVTGLTAGVAYTFTVVATNAIGTGDPSVDSNAVTPT